MKPVFTSELSKILSGFLSYISYRYPEVEYMLRPDKTTAGAGAKKRKDRSLAAQVFSNKRVTDYIEFDRAAVSLLCLQWLIRDDYDKFTHNQKKKIKLSKTSFRKLQRYVQDLVQTDEELESAIYATICNDMGKTKKVVAAYRKQIGHNDSDHDKIYSTLIEKRPELFPGIAHLSEKQKKYLIQGLKTNFNLGQLVQGENVPASLISIKKLSAPAKNLFILHSFLDIAGSSGHIDHNGSLVMNETMTRVFLIALDVLSKKITVQSYNEFLFKFGQIAGISVVNSETYALARLAALSRCYTKDEGKTIQKAWQKLSSITRAVLTKELRISGLKDETAILLYYAPAFIENLKNAYLKKSTQKMAKVDAFVLAFTKLAEVYQYVRTLIYRDFKSGVLTVEICDLAKYAYEKPLDILGFPFKIRLNPFERFGRLLFDTTHGIKEKFTPKSNLDRFFPCGRTAFIGIGGGSDIIQAAQLGLLLKEKPACFISIRSQKIGSQGAAGKINDVRFVHHHGGEIFPGVFRIMPDTTGTGRFLEHLVAGAGVPVYLVLKQSTELLQKQIQSAVAHAGGADNIVAVDTGGDCLYVKSPQKHIDAKTTPDQDFASLKAINALAGYKNKLTAVMALGVDSPPYAGRLMKNVGAQLFSFSPAQTKSLLNNYTRFKIDGKNNSFYGKTVLAFQQALRGEKNFIIVPLPVSVVVSKTAPWDPFVHLNAYSDKLIVMDLKKHFAAIDGGFKDTDNAR